MQKHIAAVAIFITLSIVMTWPLAARLDHAVADPSDPFINIWILDWDHYATFHHPLSLFDANIFYPVHDTLALSENLYGIALVLIPLRAIGLSAVTAYNIAMLGGFAFSGFAAYLLGVRLTGSFIAGIAAGVFHAFVPFRFTHLPHVQHVFAGWVPLLLVTLLGYVDRPSRRNAALFGVVFLMNGLTNIHWLLFGSFAIGATVLLFVITGVRRWRELIIATSIAAALLVPFLIPYGRVAKTMARTWTETKFYSATWSDWLVSSSANRVYTFMRDASVNPERRLFPGALSIVAALVALFLACRYPRGVTLGILWTVIGVAGSIGLNFCFHQFLFDAVPGFRGIRVPARWAEIAYIGLAMLIAVATAFVGRRQRWIAVAIPILFIVELRAAPIRWYRAPVEVPEVYRWLAKQNMRAVVELPIDVRGSEYLYMFRAVAHHKNLVNGVSGAVPPEFARLTEMSRSSPDAFIAELRRSGVDLVIVHADETAPEPWRARLPLLHRFESMGPGGDWVFTLRGPRTEARGLGQWTFGNFDRPPALRGAAFFSGYAYSPWGIRGVDLLFEDGSVRIPAILVADPKLKQFGAKPRFVSSLLTRPDGVSVESDVQAVVIDGRGQRKRLQFYWITWQ